MKQEDIKGGLSKSEIDFCDLYVNGCDPYAGNLRVCYEEVFKVTSKTSLGMARRLLSEQRIQEYVIYLESACSKDAAALKKRLTEKLLKIVDETSETTYRDRRGNDLSPAPLRSVAIQGCKALMDMYPIKETQENRLKIEGEGGVVFNVIVPEIKKETE